MKKALFYIFVLVFLLILPIYSSASDVKNEIYDSIEEEIKDFENTLPDYVLNYFPNSTISDDLSLTLQNTLNEAKLMDYIIEYLFVGLNKTLKVFNGILVLLLLSSIFEMFSHTTTSEAIHIAFSSCSSICVMMYVFNICVSLASNVTAYTKILCNTMSSFAPIMATMQILSGNISTAAISNGAIVLFISLTDVLLVACMLPLVKICMVFSCVKSMGGIEFGGISRLIRTTFTSVTIFIMSVFMFILSLKNVISQGADTLTIKTARFAISSFVPIVGASINDALRTVSASLGIIKSSCGALAIILIALIMLPIVIYLFLNKLSFGLLGGISRILKCDKQGEILDEASALCTHMLTIVCCTCILFIFAVTIFIRTSSEVIV